MSTASANIIQTADLLWQHDKLGNEVPYSKQFDDVYYSMQDGLAESYYVFAKHNALPERFAELFNLCLTSNIENNKSANNIHQNQTFTIGELGFGTGLNILMVWQLWQQTKQTYLNEKNSSASTTVSPRLHLISTEKFPLSHSDLKRSLASWQQHNSDLSPYIDQLLTLYPPLVAGCHRLHLAPDVTLDLWLGDAADSLAKISNDTLSSSISTATHIGVDAWFLDGFAPAHNDSLWELQIFEQLYRLSKPNATFATFSCAGVVKRGLTQAGFNIQKVAGFGRKRHMLTGYKAGATDLDDESNGSNPTKSNNFTNKPHIAVIGAGVSGLMAAWSLLQRGFQVTLIDKTAPLAGASGNPRALLAPKMTPITHVSEHLHSMGYLYSQRLYRQFDKDLLDENNKPPENDEENKKRVTANGSIFTLTGTIDLLLKANVSAEQIDQYPNNMASTLSAIEAEQLLKTDLVNSLPDASLYLPQAGLVNPILLAQYILTHPNLDFIKAEVIAIKQQKTNNDNTSAQVTIIYQEPKERTENELANLPSQPTIPNTFDKVVIAAAYHSHRIDNRVFDYRKIRGQLSWFVPTKQQLEKLPKLPLKYGGYCASFIPNNGDDSFNPVVAKTPTFLLGASFVRNDTSEDLRIDEHNLNREKLVTSVPELQPVFESGVEEGVEMGATDISEWLGRVGIRAQTPDYHPVVGSLDGTEQVWTISGMGSKGYAFAPLCAEVLADLITKQIPPLPNTLLARLSPQRQRLQTPLQ